MSPLRLAHFGASSMTLKSLLPIPRLRDSVNRTTVHTHLLQVTGIHASIAVYRRKSKKRNYNHKVDMGVYV